MAALWAVSPDGAKILVLRFAGCSELVPALRPEKRPPPLEAGVPDDWPKSDMVEGRVGGLSAGSYAHRIVCSCLQGRVQNFQARRQPLSGLAAPIMICFPRWTRNEMIYNGGRTS
jgi:hypothetical protein